MRGSCFQRRAPSVSTAQKCLEVKALNTQDALQSYRGERESTSPTVFRNYAALQILRLCKQDTMSDSLD